MIVKAELSNNKYRNGIDYVVKNYDRFGRVQVVNNFIGTIFHSEYPYSNSKKPYDTIQWIGKFTLQLHGRDYKDDKTIEFDNLGDAVSVMFDANDNYIGDIHQTRILSDGTVDSCCVCYNSRLFKGVA